MSRKSLLSHFSASLNFSGFGGLQGYFQVTTLTPVPISGAPFLDQIKQNTFPIGPPLAHVSLTCGFFFFSSGLALPAYVFSEKLANWHSGLETVHMFAFSGVSGELDCHVQNPSFCAEKRKNHLTEPNVPVDHFRNKIDQTFSLKT